MFLDKGIKKRKGIEMADQFKRQIVIDEDGTATYERRVSGSTTVGGPSVGRVLDSKRIAASSLIPDHGELFILPPNGLCARSEEGTTVIVTQEAPSQRSVRWNTDHHIFLQQRESLLKSGRHHVFGMTPQQFRQEIEKKIMFRLAFPYLVKFFVFRGGSFEFVTLWYRTAPILNEKDELFVPNLTNRFTDGHLCLTDGLPSRIRGKGFAEAIATIEQEFWASPWNAHEAQDFLAYARRFPQIASPWEWERSSLHDPLFPLKLDWVSGERTVGDEVRRLFGTTVKANDVFAYFYSRLRVADPYDGAPPKSESSVKISPTKALTLYVRNNQNGDRQELVVRVGDSLVFDRYAFDRVGLDGARDVRLDQPYKIEWFGRKIDNFRSVKLEGIDKPLTIIEGSYLRTGVSVRFMLKDEEEKITVCGVDVKVGTYCRFTNAKDWPGRREGVYVIERMMRSQRGLIMVQFSGEEFMTAIGEFDKLYPGVAILPAEETDSEGYLKAREIRYSDGRVISCGDKLFVGTSDAVGYYVIHRFFPIKPGDRGRVFLMRDGNKYVLEDAEGKLVPGVVLLSDGLEPDSVTVGKTTISVGESVKYGGTRYKISQISPVVNGGYVFVFIREHGWYKIFEKGKIADGFELLPTIKVDEKGCWLGSEFYSKDIAYYSRTSYRLLRPESFEAGGQPGLVGVNWRGTKNQSVSERFISDWKLTEFRPASLELDFQNIKFKAGDMLRLREDIKDFHAGKEFRVMYFISAEDGREPMIVTTSGFGISVNAGSLYYFEVMREGEWVRLVTTLGNTDNQLEPGKKLCVGAKVRYLGGDRFAGIPTVSREDVEGKIATIIGRTVDWSIGGYRWKCDFGDKVSAKLQYNGESGFAAIEGRFLCVVDSVDLKEVGLMHLFGNGKRRASRCVNEGSTAGRDAKGRTIRVGDKVRVVKLPTSGFTKLGKELVKSGHMFVVVHSGRYWSSDSPTLYLDAGKDIKQRRNHDVIGVRDVPSNLREDASWWKSLIFVEAQYCELVE